LALRGLTTHEDVVRIQNILYPLRNSCGPLRMVGFYRLVSYLDFK